MRRPTLSQSQAVTHKADFELTDVSDQLEEATQDQDED